MTDHKSLTIIHLILVLNTIPKIKYRLGILISSKNILGIQIYSIEKFHRIKKLLCTKIKINKELN